MTNERKKTRKTRAADTPEPADSVAVATEGDDRVSTEFMTVDDLVAPRNDGVGDAAAGLSGEAGEPEEPAEPPVSAELKAIVEALIYASPEPIPLKSLFKVLDSEPREDVERAVAALKQDYRQVRGLQLVEIAGGLQIVTRPDLHEWVRRLFHERKNTRLSVQSLETLAVIAYRQPVTAAEIAEIRGVNTSGVLATLVERKLIKTAGRKAVVGRPFLYATTREFLLRFGLNDLSDLPKVDDLADVLGFELPGLLNEPLPLDQMLPLGDPDEPAAADPADEPPAPDALPAGPAPEAQAAEDGRETEDPLGPGEDSVARALEDSQEPGPVPDPEDDAELESDPEPDPEPDPVN